MATRKAPTKRATKRAPRRAPEFDDLTVPGNSELVDQAVTVTLRDGIAALRPANFDRLDPAVREALADVMLLVGQRRQLGREIEGMVRHLRQHNVPWSAISWATGMTAEGARTRWPDE